MSETILNDDFDFSAAPYEVKNAFQGWPRKIRLESNERLFRMLTTEDSTRCGSSVLSGQWWFDLDTRMQLSQVSHQSGGTLPAAVQSKLAVTREFSQEMEYLCAIMLKKPIFAWIGVAKWQHDKTLGVTLLGGFNQIFVPSLAVSSNGLFSPVARIETFAYAVG